MLKLHLRRLETSEDKTGMTSGRTGDETAQRILQSESGSVLNNV